jgi:hypothetical protein
MTRPIQSTMPSPLPAPHLTLLRLMMSTRVLETEPHADANGIAVIFHFFCGKRVKKL